MDCALCRAKTTDSIATLVEYDYQGLCILQCTIHCQCTPLSLPFSYPSNYTMLLYSLTLTAYAYNDATLDYMHHIYCYCTQ